MNVNLELQSQSNLTSLNTPSVLGVVTPPWVSATLSSSTETNLTLKSRNYPHTPEQIAKELSVDENGVLWWRRKISTRSMKKPVGYIDFQGKNKIKPYIRFHLNKVAYKRSVVVFCLYHGRWPDADKVIDHIDGNSLNDHPTNLREISQRENLSTSSLRSDNTSGFKGISFVPRLNKYQAYLHKNGKKINGGHYNTKEEAIHARLKLELKYELSRK